MAGDDGGTNDDAGASSTQEEQTGTSSGDAVPLRAASAL